HHRARRSRGRMDGRHVLPGQPKRPLIERHHSVIERARSVPSPPLSPLGRDGPGRCRLFTFLSHRERTEVRARYSHYSTTPFHRLLFAVEVIGLCSFNDNFFAAFFHDCPFAAVGIITGVADGAATSWIVCDDIVDE